MQLEKEGKQRQPQENKQTVETPLSASLSEELEAVGLGNVAETVGGPAENQGTAAAATQQTSGKTAQEIEAERTKLIQSKPPQKDMIRDIRDALHKQLTGLGKEESELKKKGLKTIMQYNDVVAKIRNLNRLLRDVAQSSYKALKALWLRIVHGIV